MLRGSPCVMIRLKPELLAQVDAALARQSKRLMRRGCLAKRLNRSEWIRTAIIYRLQGGK
jgi:hypothetical protein